MNNLKWLLDAGEFWSGCGKIHNTLRHLGSILDVVGIPYAIFGRAAAFAHGFEQYNLDTDVIVVTNEGLQKMQRVLPPRGFAMISERRFRDSLTDLDFKIIRTGRLAGPEPCPIRVSRSIGVGDDQWLSRCRPAAVHRSETGDRTVGDAYA
jgi:hypothetical protein